MENNDLLRAAAQFTKTASTFGQMNGGSIPPSGPSGDPLSFLPVLSGNEYHYDHGNNILDDGAGPSTARTALDHHIPGEYHISWTSSENALLQSCFPDEVTSQPHGAHDLPEPHGAHDLPEPHGDQDLPEPHGDQDQPQVELLDLVERGDRELQLRNKLTSHYFHVDRNICDPRFERRLRIQVSFEIELEKRLRIEGFTPDCINQYRNQLRELFFYDNSYQGQNLGS